MYETGNGMKIFVLGAGMMGRAVVHDLANAREVQQIVVADFDRARAQEVARKFGRGKARAVFADVRKTSELAKRARGFDVLVNCTQYNWNLDVMRAALAARVNYMDLGGLYHMTKKQFALDRDFRRIGRLAIAGMGGAPGITNVMARALAEPLDRVDSIRVYNAGADEQKYESPIAYTFSIATILDELTMPPIAFEKGRYVEKPMLSDPEPGSFPQPIGNIVLRHSIHSELGTLAESFRKKGVREVFFKINYEPQLVNLVRNLVETGFTSRDPIAVNGAQVAPRSVLLALLQSKATTKTPKDVEALRVVVTGRRGKRRTATAMEMWADYSTRPQLSAVARDTGFPAAIAAVMLGRGEIQGVGVQAPENVVPPRPFFAELKKRGFRFRSWNVKS
ncbi:MAG TPA: saccharopine dehydrogenase C-terminal domain-containing protein [Candidatus Acidoferrales bacterium]|nr:saccharopine dehydrogenase C-terminal domain-containing protein [Candidatus Acidoferrales bacterium]